ncbi:tRNA (guanosine(37)-N1)-methyltransferase TrmD [candidate division KSB1 bacterium]|nr:tRNA (guanosine(37)-N1)-methyltransferase TrmD [candidate division KSB1 bacterium]
MKIHIITAFPGLMEGPFQESIIKRAQEKNLIEINIYNLRSFTKDKHNQIDDYPYGGGPGMVLKPEPIFDCIDHILEQIAPSDSKRLIFLTPQGKRYDQQHAKELSTEEHLIFLCGHYKGVDQRVRDYWKFDEISIGDYVLTGGELPALVIIDSVVRLIPGVISDMNSAATDSFYNNMLDCPYYTRPEVFRDLGVPSVLLSGNHAEIEKWRKQKALEITIERRQDLIKDDNIVTNKTNDE